MRGKGFLLLIVVTAAVVYGASVALRDQSNTPQVGQVLLENLLAKVNDVVVVEVTGAGEAFKIERTESAQWILPARNDFPVTPGKVRQLLVGMAALERLQPKTDKPERFVELGLSDPSDKDSRAIGLSLLDSSGTVIANLIVGDRRPAKGDATRSEFFVRIPDEDKSWLVLGSLPELAGEQVEWLAEQIATINGDRIARARITHADGEVVTVERKDAAQNSFAFVELPPGEKPAEVWRMNDTGRWLSDLMLDDVKLAAQLPEQAKEIDFVTETFDGLRVSARVYDVGADEAWVQLKAQFDQSLVSAAADKEGEKKSDAQPPATDKVQEEVKTLNDKWSRWIYRISRFKGDTVRRRQKDLIREPEADKDAKPAG